MVRAKRLSLGLGLNQLSMLTGVSSSTISRLETGERIPTKNNFSKILNYLNMRLENHLFVIDVAE